MINVFAVALILTILIGLGWAWEDLHTCHLPGCTDWTPETGPTRLCPHHRSRQLSDQDRRWATTTHQGDQP